MRLDVRRRGPLAMNKVVAAAQPTSLRASLESMLADDPAVSVRLRCQVEDVRGSDSPIRDSRSTRDSRSSAARPTPPLSPTPLPSARG